MWWQVHELLLAAGRRLRLAAGELRTAAAAAAAAVGAERAGRGEARTVGWLVKAGQRHEVRAKHSRTDQALMVNTMARCAAWGWWLGGDAAGGARRLSLAALPGLSQGVVAFAGMGMVQGGVAEMEVASSTPPAGGVRHDVAGLRDAVTGAAQQGCDSSSSSSSRQQQVQQEQRAPQRGA